MTPLLRPVVYAVGALGGVQVMDTIRPVDATTVGKGAASGLDLGALWGAATRGDLDALGDQLGGAAGGAQDAIRGRIRSNVIMGILAGVAVAAVVDLVLLSR